MKKSKTLFLFLMSLFVAVSFVGCKKENKNPADEELNWNARAFRELSEKKDGKQLTVLCTVFPLYDWCKSVLGGDSNSKFKLELMMKKGTDLHNFQPSVADLAKLNSADVLFYIGGESDKWIEEALKSSKNKSQMRFSLMSNINEASKIDFFEGLSLLEEDDFGEEENEGNEEETEYDEHIWLSLKNASFGVQFMEGVFQNLDPQNAEEYQVRLEKYLESMKQLDEEFKTVLSGNPVLLFADRFPFRYFTEDYDLPYYAAFPGCSAESEASFSTLVTLIETVQKQNLKNIYVLEDSNKKMAAQIIQAAGTDTKIKVLNSMQNVTDIDIRNGVTYLKLMEQNLEALRGND
ncbi:MAG: metal ABC transporter substrate-binding protein [Treponema sp.]|nr:metal ABC transporter substrate-binding protein [Treponema sp.]